MEECIICGTTLYIGSGVCFDCELKEREGRHIVPRKENQDEEENSE